MNRLWLNAQILLELMKKSRTSALMMVDFLLIFLASYLAYSLRLGVLFEPTLWQLVLIFVLGLLCVVSLLISGFYSQMVRYSGEQLTVKLLKGLSFGILIWMAFVYMTKSHELGDEGVPRTIPMLIAGLAFFGIYGLRWARRWHYWRNQPNVSRKPFLLYGTGKSAFSLLKALEHNGEMECVAIIGDRANNYSRDFMGQVVMPLSAVPTLLKTYNIKDCVVALEKMGRPEDKEAILYLEKLGIKPRILPPLERIASGENVVSHIREVSLADLLGRETVQPSTELMQLILNNKVVLITGAGGSIGSELCQQAIAFGAKKLIMLDQSEPSLYESHRKLEMNPESLIPVIGSVTNTKLLEKIFSVHKPDVIFHAAAHKHVPLVESNVEEGFENNVLGTMCVAEMAAKHKAERFVMVSTDKAVRPTNVMGATKRWAEIGVNCIQRQAQKDSISTIFCSVRFGNVLGSSGSVIPLFREQIAKGGPVTVTHRDVTRFFMSISEAAQLVIQAGALARGGEVFLLDMGEPVKILELAENMIRLAGLEPVDPTSGEGSIEIKFTGLRPGEKLYEELLFDLGDSEPTDHPKIIKAREFCPEAPEFEALLARVKQLVSAHNVDHARETLLELANRQPPGDPE